MYGVPDSLPLGDFIGLRFDEVRSYQFQTQFCCPGGVIDVESRWELRDTGGTLLAEWHGEQGEPAGPRIQLVVGVEIVGYEVDAPKAFTVIFASGVRLSVFDESAAYESFSIRIGKHFVHV